MISPGPEDDGVMDDPARIDAAWVQRALARAGVVGPGAVAAIEVATTQASSWSRLTRIRVHYRPGAPGAGLQAPAALLLKHCGAGSGEFGRSEVDYYLRDYLGAADAPLPRCFAAAYAEPPRRYHLLLEDLSASHCTGDDAPRDLALALALADSLAALHAHRWGVQRLQAVGQAVAGATQIDRYLAHIRPGLAPLIAGAGDALPAAWGLRLPGLVDSLADVFKARARDCRGMTLVHGDLNPGNLLVPRRGAGRLLLIDRQPFDWSLTAWLGVSDLAGALVPWWDSALRRQVQGPALARYHAGLLARGVRDYAAEQLQADWHLGVLMCLLVPVEWCVLPTDRERMRWLWTVQLQRALAALDELPA